MTYNISEYDKEYTSLVADDIVSLIHEGYLRDGRMHIITGQYEIPIYMLRIGDVLSFVVHMDSVRHAALFVGSTNRSILRPAIADTLSRLIHG